MFGSMRINRINTDVTSRGGTFVDVQHWILHFYKCLYLVVASDPSAPPLPSPTLPAQVSGQGNENILFW